MSSLYSYMIVHREVKAEIKACMNEITTRKHIAVGVIASGLARAKRAFPLNLFVLKKC